MLEGAMYLGSNPQKTIQFFSPIVINNQEVKMRLLILGLLFSAACSAPIVHINPENGESIEFWLNDGGTVEKKAEILADGTLKVDAVETLAGGTPTLGGNALGALAQEDTVGASEIDTDAVGSDEIAEGAVGNSELADAISVTDMTVTGTGTGNVPHTCRIVTNADTVGTVSALCTDVSEKVMGGGCSTAQTDCVFHTFAPYVSGTQQGWSCTAAGTCETTSKTASAICCSY